MLLVVIGNITWSSPVEDSSSTLVRWLAMVEQTPSYTLCLLHAVLAKLPPAVLTGANLKEKPLLLAVFFYLNELFDKYVSIFFLLIVLVLAIFY